MAFSYQSGNIGGFNYHPGSWSVFGVPLPDFGVTENYSNMLGQGRTPQGGSSLFSPPPGNTPPGNTPPGNTPPGNTPPGNTPPGNTPRPPSGGNPTPSNLSPDTMVNSGTYGDTNPSQKSWRTILAETGGSGRYNAGGGSNGPDYGQINSVFDEVNNLLNQRQQTTEAGRNDYINQYTGQFDAQKPLLQQGYNEGLALNQQQGQEAGLQREQAQAGQRQLFQELNQGNQQRFGGTSSAGDVSSALQGRQFQQNMGNIQNTYGQNQQQLAQKATQLQQNYQANLQSLEQQKQSAISQAQIAFQQRLDEIGNMRIQNEQGKAQAKLNVLQELRTNAQNIQNAYIQQRMSLENAAKQSVAQIAGQIAQWQTYSRQPVNLQSIPTQVIPAINQIYGSGDFAQGQQTGYGRRIDEFGRPY